MMGGNGEAIAEKPLGGAVTRCFQTRCFQYWPVLVPEVTPINPCGMRYIPQLVEISPSSCTAARPS